MPTKSVAFVVFAAVLAFGGAVGRGTRREAVAGKPLLLPVPGLFQVGLGRHDGARGAEAMLQCRMGEIPGVRAGGAEAAILDIEQVPRVDLATGGDTEAGRRGHREQPVQFNGDAGGTEWNVPDVRVGGSPGQFDQDAGGAHGCASPDTAADAGEAASCFFTVSIVRLG